MIQNPVQDDELNMQRIVAALRRRWPWLVGGSLCGLIVATGLNIFTKPTWKGEFQIVLAQKERGGGGGLGALVAANPMLAQLAGFGAGPGGAELDTEVKILESPLVLKPVFDYVKAYKISTGKASTKLRFNSWAKRNLKIKLSKGTSVLVINYFDKDRAIVLPVLQRISRAYQIYSGRDRSESLRRGLAYVTNQVARFRREAELSNRAADAFSIRYGISSSGNAITSAGIDVGKLLNSASGRQQGGGTSINITGGGSNEAANIANQGDPLGQLAAINQELIRRQQQFTDRDPTIAALKRERNAMRRYIESTAGGYIALPGQTNLSKDKAQDIMLRFQELDRAAKRNTAILDSLENSMMTLQLEQARASRPWDLISDPTLFEEPDSPKPIQNLLLGLIAGLLVGSGIALRRDRNCGIIYTADELKQLLPYPLLTTLHTQPESWDESLSLLAQGPLSGAEQVGLIAAGAVPNATQIAEHLQSALQAVGSASQVVLSTDLSVTQHCSIQLVLAAPGVARRQNLIRLQQHLLLQGNPVCGLLILDDAA